MSYLISTIERSLEKADEYKSKITKEILEIPGMSGKKTRHFYNNICSMNNARYLEIGTWTGSSICSAMCNNNMKCLAIDNWSEFCSKGGRHGCPNGPKVEFMNNFNKFKGKNDATFIEKNCWDIDVHSIGKFNIYMYDGEHSESSHFKALTYYLECLDDEFIYLVDDWNCNTIKNGTNKAIKENKLTIVYQKEIFTKAFSLGWGVKGGYGKDGDWHNGIGIFVLKKNR
jgi:hypothetical protein